MRLIIHAGVAKTGTTSIQHFLWNNQRVLDARGVTLCDFLGKINNRILPSLFLEDSSDDDGYLRRVGLGTVEKLTSRKELVREQLQTVALSGANTVIVTSEQIQSRLKSERSLRELREFLTNCGFQRIEVILYFRDPISLARSLYTTALLAGSVRRSHLCPDEPHVRNLCDHQATVERFSRVFGESCLAVNYLGSESLLHSDLLDDFCKLAGLKREGLTSVSNQNPSLNAAGQGLLRNLNRLRMSSLPRALAIHLIRRVFSGNPPEMLEAVQEEYWARYGSSWLWLKSWVDNRACNAG